MDWFFNPSYHQKQQLKSPCCSGNLPSSPIYASPHPCRLTQIDYQHSALLCLCMREFRAERLIGRYIETGRDIEERKSQARKSGNRKIENRHNLRPLFNNRSYSQGVSFLMFALFLSSRSATALDYGYVLPYIWKTYIPQIFNECHFLSLKKTLLHWTYYSHIPHWRRIMNIFLTQNIKQLIIEWYTRSPVNTIL